MGLFALSGESTSKIDVKLAVVTGLLLALWLPVVIDKGWNFDLFKSGLAKQPLSPWMVSKLIYILPAIEGLTAALLMTAKTRKWGMRLSAVLMAIFTGYVGLMLLQVQQHRPCVCGSVVSLLGSWWQHFFFNLAYLVVSVWGVLLTAKRKINTGPAQPKGMDGAGGPTGLAYK